MHEKKFTLIDSVFTEKLFQLRDFGSRDCGDDFAGTKYMLCELACEQTSPTYYNTISKDQERIEEKSRADEHPAGTKTVFPARSP